MPGVKLIPYGELQGRVAVEVDVASVPLETEGALTSAILRALVPGAAAVEFVNAPWGVAEFDRALMLLSADGRTEDLVLWACRDVYETRWAAHPLWWVLDASTVFASSTTVTDVVNAINTLPFLPPPAEIIIRNPHAHSISATVLDEVHTRLDSGASWVYIAENSPDKAAIEREIARATTAWGLRVLPSMTSGEHGTQSDKPGQEA